MAELTDDLDLLRETTCRPRATLDQIAAAERRDLLNVLRRYLRAIDDWNPETESEVPLPKAPVDVMLAITDDLRGQLDEARYWSAQTALCVIALTNEVADLKRRVGYLESMLSPRAAREKVQ